MLITSISPCRVSQCLLFTSFAYAHLLFLMTTIFLPWTFDVFFMTMALLLGWKFKMSYVYRHPFHDLILKMLELLFMACPG